MFLFQSGTDEIAEQIDSGNGRSAPASLTSNVAGRRLLLSSTELGVIERTRVALESAGIRCVVRNEMIAGVVGEVPFTECTPEIWIVDDDRFREAKQIVAALNRAPATAGPAWTCPGCDEIIEGQFDSCWRCGRQRT